MYCVYWFGPWFGPWFDSLHWSRDRLVYCVVYCVYCVYWSRDRFRTMINVLGDALAAGIIAHLCRKDFPLSGAGQVPPHRLNLP